MTFSPTNLIKVGNFLKSMGFENLELSGELNLRVDDFLRLKQRLEELELKPKDVEFELLDNIPFTWYVDNDNERTKN